MMERAASSSLPHAGAQFSSTGMPRAPSNSFSGNAGSAPSGNAFYMQMMLQQQQNSSGLSFPGSHSQTQGSSPPGELDLELEDDRHLATMELFRRLSHSEASPAPSAKMDRAMSCGGGPLPAVGGGSSHSSQSITSASMGKLRPSLKLGSSSHSSPNHHRPPHTHNNQRSGNMQQLNGPDGKLGHGHQGGEFDLPSSITVTPTTDAMQAAGLINLALSQPGASSFLLQVQPQQPKQQSKGSRSLLATAISVILATRKINAATQNNSEVAMLPNFIANSPATNHQGTAPQDSLEIHIYRLHVPPHLRLMQAQCVRVDHSSSPLVLALQLAQAVQGGSVVDVAFSLSTASTALQTMALARTNISSSGQDMVLILQHADNNYGICGSPHLNTFSYKAKAISTALLLQTRDPSSSNSPLPSPVPSALDFAALSMGTMPSMRATPSPPPPNAADPSSLMTSASLVDRLASGYNQYRANQPPNAVAMSSSSSQQQSSGSQGPFAGYSMGAWGGSMVLPDASAFPSPHHSSNPALAGLLGCGAAGGPLSLLASVAAANARPRARKADWVIVTEDTAIKNAAGAVAKVLGRVSDQGLCCPVFTEKKTERYTAVISVAVKAITVARGYVSNEGTGQELGFQPYLRGDSSSPMQAGDAGSSGNVGRGGSGAGEQDSRNSGYVGDAAQEQDLVGEQQQGVQGKGGEGKGEGQLSGGAEVAVGSGGASPRGGVTEGERGAVASAIGGDAEQAEMAFDVYKLPQMPEMPEVGTLPVKVTAHSRPNVVSNIITKLVNERDGAVLITAGGKAMHVAMTAVVSARARLRARCCDVLLLPRFVTVDTTSTLGWESVFLRFTIVRWPLLPSSGSTVAAMGAGLNMAAMGAGMMGAGGGSMAGSMVNNPWAPLGAGMPPNLSPLMGSMASGNLGGMAGFGGLNPTGLSGFDAPPSFDQASAQTFLLPPHHAFMGPFVGRGC